RGCYIYDLVFLCGRKSRTASDIIRPSRSRDRRVRRDGLGVGLGVHGVDVGPELAHLRRDLFAEARAVENAVMADLPLQVVQPPRLRDVDAQVLGSESLADPANVVLLALDRHEAAMADRLQVDELAAMLHRDCLEIGGAGAEAVVWRLISDRG